MGEREQDRRVHDGGKMKIYLAGKITGLSIEEYRAAFKAAAHDVLAAGHLPLCPVEMFPENPIWDWAEYMLADLRIIWHHADALLMIDGWEDSKGAQLERQAALAVDKPVYYSLNDIPKEMK